MSTATTQFPTGRAEVSHGIDHDLVSSLRLRGRSGEEVEQLRRGAHMGMRNMVYGVTDGPELSDMQSFPGTAANFLRAVSDRTTSSCADAPCCGQTE